MMGIATIVNSAGERFTTGGTYWNGVSSTTKGIIMTDINESGKRARLRLKRDVSNNWSVEINELP